ncbi:MAG: hypothetical protein ACR2GW_10665 [Pyrinomonadaceae bacterium]
MPAKHDPAHSPDNLKLFADDAPKSSSLIKLGAVVCALLLTVSLLLGYLFLRQRHNRRIEAEKQAQLTAQQVSPPIAHIKENEARLKGSEAILSGTISNISNQKIEKLSLEFELKQRGGSGTEHRTIEVAPPNLNPGEEGHYSFAIASKEWSSARIVHLRDGRNDITFKTSLGDKRPAERTPQNPKVVVAPRPKPKGEGFINTPDNPIPIK